MGYNKFAILTVRVAIVSQRWHIEARLCVTQPVHVEHISVQTACLYCNANMTEQTVLCLFTIIIVNNIRIDYLSHDDIKHSH